MKQISSVEADWKREAIRQFWDPGRKLLKSIRDYQQCKSHSGIIAKLFSKICVARHLFWSTVSGADIPLNCSLGGGLLIPHPNALMPTLG